MQNPQRIFLFFSLLAIGLFFLPFTATGADIIIKYYIYSMESKEDEKKVVDYIAKHAGVTKIETVLDRHWIYIHYEDDILNDERYQLRLPLREELGYPVERWEIQWEHTEGQD